jgi:hypothetical protein
MAYVQVAPAGVRFVTVHVPASAGVQNARSKQAAKNNK